MTSTRQIPVLIALGIGFSWFFAGSAAIALAFTIVDALFLGGVGQYNVYGNPVSPSQFLATGGPVFLASAALLIGIAWGLRKRRQWARHAVVTLWVALLAISLFAGGSRSEAVEAAISLAPFLIFSWWYFFRKLSVLAYFDEESASTEDPRTSGVRPVGLTLLAIVLAWLSLAGFGNAAIYVGGVRLATMNSALVFIAVLYGITAAFAAFGLWLLKPWAPRAFLAWSICVVSASLVMGFSLPTDLFLGGIWAVCVFNIFIALLLYLLNRYVRGACSRAA